MKWSSGWRGVWVLLALALAVYGPGLASIGAVDRDESRFAQASRQMFEALALPEPERDPALHSGGLAIPYVQDVPRLNKPPLIYWLQSACAWALTGGEPSRDAIWMYRVPSVLSALAAGLLTWRLGLRMFEPRTAMLAGALLMVGPVVMFDAHQARADQLLLATVVATQRCLFEVWVRSRRSVDGAGARGGTFLWAMALWACLGLSVLAKGPIGPMIALLSACGLLLADRRRTGWGFLGGLWIVPGVLVLGAMVLPWAWAVGAHFAERNGTDVVQGLRAYLELVRAETVGRAGGSREGHWGPPGMYLLLLAATFWPGSLLTLAGVVRGFARGTRGGSGLRLGLGGRGAELFLIAWTVPAWVFFELFGAKLLHYVLPMYPALALLTARAVMGCDPRRFSRAGTGIWLAIGLGAALATLGASAWVMYWGLRGVGGGGGGGATTGAAIALGASIIAIFGLLDHARPRGESDAQRARDVPRATVASIVAACVLWAGVMQGLGPWVVPGAGSRAIGMILAQAENAQGRPIASTYREDSIVFTTRGAVDRLEPEAVVDWVEQHPAGLLVLRAEDRAQAERLPMRVLGSARWFEGLKVREADVLEVAWPTSERPGREENGR
ncbi:MAG: glycosyltransferase family 39 protein [Planctomycetota bacterium]|nr:glycosyltransferase family 39 protein [Planctomycetota bacterium]